MHPRSIPRTSAIALGFLYLANGCADDAISPTEERSGPFESISAGIYSCALTPTDATYCWGDGDAATNFRTTPAKLILPAGLTLASIEVGNSACGLAQDGETYCWGANEHGQLGDGTTTDRLAPVAVATPTGVTFVTLGVAVGAYGHHACGLTPDGQAYCWGDNVSGQLGDGTTTRRLTPTAVALPPGITFTTLAVGSQHTCGLTPGGAAYCWGDNEQAGQLGDGTTTDRLTPTSVALPAGVALASLAISGYHSCGLTAEGAAYCWGYNHRGRLGDGTDTNRHVPTAVVMPAGVSFASLAVGYDHTCALTGAGAAYCWGRNAFGQVGDGTTTHRLEPVPVAMPADVTIASLSAGWDYACALTPDGQAYCWGVNLNGRLGDGTTLHRLSPTKVVQ